MKNHSTHHKFGHRWLKKMCWASLRTEVYSKLLQDDASLNFLTEKKVLSQIYKSKTLISNMNYIFMQ